MLMNERNERVARALSTKHDGVTIFCVSNTLYSEHRNGLQEGSQEYIRLSRIQDLRRHCQLVPAEAQMAATTAYLEHQVPALLGSLRQWTLSGQDNVGIENSNNLRIFLEDLEKTIRRV